MDYGALSQGSFRPCLVANKIAFPYPFVVLLHACGFKFAVCILFSVYCRILSPLSVAPLVALVGFGLYELGFPVVSYLNNIFYIKVSSIPLFISISLYLTS